ncbi:MAG TPA: hypothetical protein VMT24_00690 [Aggregatilineaceae bacterium]|nr:hypothetical protein [Aggregatilineaceae bacterium]
MVTKRVFFVLLIAAFSAAVVLAARVPLAGGQGESGITVNLTPYEGNPILGKGPAGSWDSVSVWAPTVVFHDGLYHMFYTGTRPGWPTFEIGYATSTDGLTWEKYAGNPVFKADGTGFDATAVGASPVMVEGDTWVLYYMGEKTVGVGGPIGRATAPDPTGPWTRSEDPVLTSGSQGEWDAWGTIPCSVISTGEGYVMYYLGLGSSISAEVDDMIGMATSPDGITWTKYDDPTTADPPYAESDPVLPLGLEGWQLSNIYEVTVRSTADGWEMFYSEKGWSKDDGVPAYRIGYATSVDGIHWTKYAGFPVLSYKDDPVASLSLHLVPSSVLVNDSTYFLYYDYHWSTGGGIGVATGTVTRE